MTTGDKHQPNCAYGHIAPFLCGMIATCADCNRAIGHTTPNGRVNVQVQYEDCSFWLTQKRMSELFGVDVRTVNEHLGNIYASNELPLEATVRKIRIVQQEGSRSVSRELDFYNLDAIIAVGYRVNSYQATQFRIWATNTLKEFIIKGFVLDDERLKQGSKFGADYFDELLERIRENRAARGITTNMQEWVRFLNQSSTAR